MFKVVCNL